MPTDTHPEDHSRTPDEAELNETQLEAAVGGVTSSTTVAIIPCVKVIVPCVKVIRPS